MAQVEETHRKSILQAKVDLEGRLSKIREKERREKQRRESGQAYPKRLVSIVLSSIIYG